ncbi:MAG: hypothetical protein OXT72_05425 [Gammaproteobacteria bacterium]|nr:hypothetical protein [Gammaproteobacteria bacterium]MDE0247806.1 hypothetical protein [Gammaproteobacteria bacterium]
MRPPFRLASLTGLLLLPLCLGAEADAQYIPLVVSEDHKWAVSAIYQMVDDYRPSSLDLMGIRLRRNLTDWLGVEAAGARFVGSGHDRGSGLAHFGLSLYHTLVPATEDHRFQAGYAVGVTRTRVGDFVRSLHGQLWGTMRLLGGPERSLSVGAREGWFQNSQKKKSLRPGVIEVGSDYSGFGRTFGLVVLLGPYHLRVEYEGRTNAVVEHRHVVTSEVGLRW